MPGRPPSAPARALASLTRADLARIAALAAVRVLETALDRARGISSLSDDDYARASIALRFAARPALDPSGTSWLPAPFWVVGGAMRAFGASLEVARATHATLSVASVALLYVGARELGLAPAAAWVGCLLAMALEPARVLGSVATPELPAAALAAYALLAVAGGRAGAAGRAAVAIATAALCRYEAWPVAAVVAAALVVDPRLGRRRHAWAVVALAAPAAWMAWNRHAHGDALHFLARVRAYRAALADGAPPASAALARWASAVGRDGPVLLAPLVAITALAADASSGRLARWLWPAAGAGAIVAFVAAGEAIGGAPTHHPERALLVLWLLLAVAWADVALPAMVRARSAALRAALSLALLGVLLVDARAAQRLAAELRGRRDAEEAAGRALARIAAPGERALVVTDDYGAEAIVAAFGRPGDATIDVTRADPRRGARVDPLASAAALEDAARAADATWVVARALPAGSPAWPAIVTGAYSAWRTR